MDLEFLYKNTSERKSSDSNDGQTASAMSEKFSEKEIWLKFRQGNREAYAFMYETYFFQLFNYGRQCCNNKEMVKDCIQELFVELWNKRKNLGETDSIKYYLFKALKRKIIRKIRQHSYLSSPNLMLEKNIFEIVLPLENHLIAQQDEKERIQKIRDAVNTLSAQQREVIFLMFYENLSYEQIASILSVKTKTVRNLFGKAIQALKSKLLFFLFLFLLTFS